MNDWIITSNDNFIQKGNFNLKLNLNHGFKFYCSVKKENYYLKDEKNAIFVFGYYKNRLKATSKLKNLEYLFEVLINYDNKPNDYIKGIFTIVIIDNGNFRIFNDPLGISKYFYLVNKKVFSGRIHYCKLFSDKSISNKNLLEYYVFNYNLNGNTFFKDIKYSKPATLINENVTGDTNIGEYFEIIDFLSQENKKLSKKDSLTLSLKTWEEIIKQYVDVFNGENIASTLTAGLDSRIILGGLLNTGYKNISTFTFGHSESYDVIYAKEFAQKFQLNHFHELPDSLFFENFENFAKNVHTAGDSLVSIYRAHRFMAYKNVMQNSSSIFMGMGGSDLVRGFGYDGLIVSDIAFNTWNRQSINEYLNNLLNIKLKGLGFSSTESISDNMSSYWYIEHPMWYLFKVIIPLHFSQDVLMNSNNGWETYLPFLDMDYLDFLKKSYYFEINDFKHYKLMNYKKRARGLYYSAYLANNLNKNFAKHSLGKGYSAKDIVDSQFKSTLKGLLYKFNNRNTPKVANFSYDNWFYNYLKKFFKENNMCDINLNHDYFTDYLGKISTKGGELHFLDLVKAVNIYLSFKENYK